MSTSIAILRAAGVTDAQILRIRELEEEAKAPKLKPVSLVISSWPDDYAELFWQNYPRHVAKKAALASLERAKSTGLNWDRLFHAVLRYSEHCRGKDEKYIKHPTTWLNQGCWDDEYKGNGNGVVDICRQLIDEVQDRRASAGFSGPDFFRRGD
jgi:hypothetical protein